MARKRQTIDPDLFAKTERPIPDAEPPSAQQDREPVSQPTIKTAQAAIKATYYLSPAAVDAVDVTQAQLRRLAPAERRALSKSKVVSAMLLMAAEFLQDSETASQFVSMLVNQ